MEPNGELGRWRFDDILIEPAPLQKPHPPLWLAAGRPESLRYAALEGYNLFLDQFQTFEVIAERLGIYRQALIEAGRAVDPLGAAVARGLMFAATAEEREAQIQARMRTLEVMNAHGRGPGGGAKSSMASDDDLRKAAEEGTLIGSPGDIVQQLKRMERDGVGYVLIVNRSPEALRTFAAEVMPAFS